MLMVAADAASLEKVEKVENVETKVVADNVAEPAAPVPALKTEPAGIIEAKSDEVVEEKALPVERIEAETPVAELKSLVPEKTEPVEAEHSDQVCDPLLSYHTIADEFVSLKKNMF